MGFNDRNYGGGQQSFRVGRPSTVVMTIILINVGVFLFNGLFGQAIMSEFGPQLMTLLGIPPFVGEGIPAHANLNMNLNDLLAVHSNTLYSPWLWWQYLTYGFCQAPLPNYMHIVGNMLGLFFLGRMIEQRLGSKEFLRVYLLMIVLGGLVFNLTNMGGGSVIGASGAVVGIVVMFAVAYPKMTLLIWGVLPVPAWLVGVVCISGDLFGASGASGSSDVVAHGVHLTGAAFGFCYIWFGWNITRTLDGIRGNLKAKRGPKLRVRRAEDDERTSEPAAKPKPTIMGSAKHDAEVDRILAKVKAKGQDSLTRREHKTLEEASRRLNDRDR